MVVLEGHAPWAETFWVDGPFGQENRANGPSTQKGRRLAVHRSSSDPDPGTSDHSREDLSTRRTRPLLTPVRTVQDTVNVALRLIAGQDAEGRDIDAALDRLAQVPFMDRAEAWR
jgi:hypothetical protein